MTGLGRCHKRVPLFVAAAALTASFLASPLAQAKEQELQLGLLAGVGILEGSTVGPGVAVSGSYGLTDFLDADLFLSLTTLHSYPGDNHTTVVSPRLGPTFKWDIARWVPFAGVMGGLYAHVGDNGPSVPGGNAPGLGDTNFGISVHYGADYLYSREFSITGRIEHNLLVSSPRTGWYHLILGGVQWHFD